MRHGLAGEALVVAGAGGFFVSLLAGAEAATRRWKLHPEQSRKLAHVTSGVAAACLPLVMSFRAVVVLALLFVPFMVVSRRVGLFPAVHGVERATWGEVWFPLGVLLAAALFPHEVPYTFGVLVMGLSDAAASAAGHRGAGGTTACSAPTRPTPAAPPSWPSPSCWPLAPSPPPATSRSHRCRRSWPSPPPSPSSRERQAAASTTSSSRWRVRDS